MFAHFVSFFWQLKLNKYATFKNKINIRNITVKEYFSHNKIFTIFFNKVSFREIVLSKM